MLLRKIATAVGWFPVSPQGAAQSLLFSKRLPTLKESPICPQCQGRGIFKHLLSCFPVALGQVCWVQRKVRSLEHHRGSRESLEILLDHKRRSTEPNGTWAAIAGSSGRVRRRVHELKHQWRQITSLMRCSGASKRHDLASIWLWTCVEKACCLHVCREKNCNVQTKISLKLAFITGSRRRVIKQPLEITDAEEPTLKKRVYNI